MPVWNTLAISVAELIKVGEFQNRISRVVACMVVYLCSNNGICNGCWDGSFYIQGSKDINSKIFNGSI